MEKMNRRKFIGTTVAGTVAMTTMLRGASNTEKPKLKTGLIGCGWYGMVDVKAAFKVGGVEIVAVCDIDSEHLNKSADEIEKIQGSRPRTFKSYNKLLDTPELEAVIIASPPHWHALMFIAALEKGLDVYCEKPLAYDINEGKAMVAAGLCKSASSAGRVKLFNRPGSIFNKAISAESFRPRCKFTTPPAYGILRRRSRRPR